MRYGALALVACLLGATLLVVDAAPAAACSCASPEDRDRGYVDGADVVFRGSVTASEREDAGDAFASVVWTFAVDSVVKGSVGDPQDVETGSSSAACGYGFQIGHRYEVYAQRRDDGSLTTGLCSGTHRLPSLPIVALAGSAKDGYWLGNGEGTILSYGDAPVFAGLHGGLAGAVVAMSPTPSGSGLWLSGDDGGVFAFGDAEFAGSAATLPLVAPIVGMSATPSGDGYWLAAADGGVFAFGDASFFGRVSPTSSVVGIAATPSGAGYWLVEDVGTVHALGDAAVHGSANDLALNEPIVAIAITPGGDGYWLAAADGGVFAFGDAQFAGALAGQRLQAPVSAMFPASGAGYWLAAEDGGVFAFGDAPFFGSAG